MEKNPEPSCPGCHSCYVIPLLSTLPGFAPYDSADQGRLPVGQCAESETELETQWKCEDCGEKWKENTLVPAK